MTQDIANINTLFAPFNLQVNDVIKTAQSIKYIIKLPLDLKLQGKIKRAESNIRYALSSALNTNEYTYGHDKDSVYIERRSGEFQVVKFNDIKDVTHTKKLMLVLGKDENGNKVFTNLSKAPHILVGGTTGSGKSELLHCFVGSLIEGMTYTNVEICIIDPKRAEFSPYKDLVNIHVVTDMDKACWYLNKAVDEMERRYALLEKAGAKDIYQYSGEMNPVVIVIDELADLILEHPESEKMIVRIAQKARACGIHLIIGTQSPRRDIVTGLIKANIPTRIALHTSTQMESRIVLDQSGAENLLGQGDMLYLANGALKPIRMQSAYVDKATKEYLINKLHNARVIKPEPKVEVKPAAPKTEPTPAPTPVAKPKRMGLIQTMKALMSVKPIMFQSDDYPPKI